ncbi:formylglycine-generating enzyme family protein [Spongiibacter sp. KMU-166]|uniref:Formylglycine-generating enzyme family protein n=1 Tax=Spongiibacter thalassae TaxID=2721624 RepID=A0ABX1G9X0_9GAMM|nr:formylglycine-generating enzyme family protein [Spongiibacter thalassae]NKI15955.1 formylglycine-generating enzyme family protein [Spongiibacter thalassae]
MKVSKRAGVLLALFFALVSFYLFKSVAVPSTPEGMVFIPGQVFTMGLDHPMTPDAMPLHKVRVNSFYIDATEVTNAAFQEFVSATGYITTAERPLDPKDYPGVDPSLLVPGSLVFTAPKIPVNKRDYTQWWRFIPNANWRHPEGPGSTISERMNHPVVHVTWEDASAYASWANKRLPTEAEWELAARGGLSQAEFSWGNQQHGRGNFLANIFQGIFPHKNTSEDGFFATSPVATFSANGMGLYDVAGNVWEWVQDWYDPTYYKQLENGVADNPKGPSPNSKLAPFRVQKGGSFLCTDDYCARYRPGARGKGDPNTSSNHVGFRLVKDIN